eukprot:scaffold127583_cov14-Tisochrysis_lutea.AAC.1
MRSKQFRLLCANIEGCIVAWMIVFWQGNGIQSWQTTLAVGWQTTLALEIKSCLDLLVLAAIFAQ